MDSYYPILSGCLTEPEKEVYIEKIFKEFYIEGLGVKCVREEPWVTVAETCEFIIALIMSGNISKAKKILIEVLKNKNKFNERTAIENTNNILLFFYFFLFFSNFIYICFYCPKLKT